MLSFSFYFVVLLVGLLINITTLRGIAVSLIMLTAFSMFYLFEGTFKGIDYYLMQCTLEAFVSLSVFMIRRRTITTRWIGYLAAVSLSLNILAILLYSQGVSAGVFYYSGLTTVIYWIQLVLLLINPLYIWADRHSKEVRGPFLGGGSNRMMRSSLNESDRPVSV